jgi:hypothetical protein
MKWTKDSPKESGWYWFKRDFDSDIEIIKIVISTIYWSNKENVPAVLCTVSHGSEGEYYTPVTQYKGVWSDTFISMPT